MSAAPQSAPSYTLHTFPYSQVGDLTISLDVYSPTSPPSPTAPTPLLVFFHGGCLIFGDRKSFAPLYLITPLTSLGWTVVSADYRLLPEASLEDINTDLAALQAYVQAGLNPALTAASLPPTDPARVVVAGASAGGYLALQAGWQWQAVRPRAVVDLYGMSLASEDWYCRPHPEARPQQAFLPAEVDEEGEERVLGGKVVVSGWPITPTGWTHPRMALYRYLVNKGRYWEVALGVKGFAVGEGKRALLPLLNVGEGYPATVVLHGTADGTVPCSESDEVVRVLKGKGVEVEYHRVEGKEHGLDARPDPAVEPSKQAILNFIIGHVQ